MSRRPPQIFKPPSGVKQSPKPRQPDYYINFDLQDDTQEDVVEMLLQWIRDFNPKYGNVFAMWSGLSDEKPKYIIRIPMYKRSSGMTEEALIIMSRLITEQEIKFKLAYGTD